MKRNIIAIALILFCIVCKGQIDPEKDIIISRVQYSEIKSRAERLPAMSSLVVKWSKKYDSLLRVFQNYQAFNSALLSDQNEVLKATVHENNRIKDQLIKSEESHKKEIDKFRENSIKDRETINNLKGSLNYCRTQVNKFKRKRGEAKNKVSINGKNSSLDIIKD